MTDTTTAGAANAPAAGRPTPATIRTNTLTAIRNQPGEWTTGRTAARLGIRRHQARTALITLAAEGHLCRHEHRGRTFYTLNHAKGGTR